MLHLSSFFTSSSEGTGKGLERRALPAPERTERISSHAYSAPLHKLRAENALPTKLLTPFQVIGLAQHTVLCSLRWYVLRIAKSGVLLGNLGLAHYEVFYWFSPCSLHKTAAVGIQIHETSTKPVNFSTLCK